MKHTHSVIGAIVAAISMSASAGDFYAGLGVGYSPVTGSARISNGDGAAMFGTVGYNVAHDVAAEIGLIEINGWKAMTDSASQNQNATIDASVTTTSIVGFYPFRESADIYVRLGYANAKLTWATNGQSGIVRKTSMTYGIGVEFGHNEDAAFRIRAGLDHYDLSGLPGVPLYTNSLAIGVFRVF